MRCKECNVDLPENYTLCPLCGSAAADEEVKIKGLKAVPYSTEPAPEKTELKKIKSPFSFEKIKAYFNL